MENIYNKIDADQPSAADMKLRRMSLNSQPLQYPFEEDRQDPFDSVQEEIDGVKAWWHGRQNRWAAWER